MNERQRLGTLDGLRGLMSLWVVIGHACTFTGMTYIPVLRSPKYAVHGFMILSGFLMTYHYVLRSQREPWTSWRTWTAFYARRYFRISPLYYVLLIPSFLFLDKFQYFQSAIRATLPSPGYALGEAPPISWSNVAFHVTYLFGLLPRYHWSLILPDWSLSLEMQFYFVFPFLMLLVRLRGWLAFSVITTSLWLIASSDHVGYSQHFAQPSPLPLSLIWFVIGMVWAGSYVGKLITDKRWVLFGCSLSLLSFDLHDVILVVVFAWVLFADGWLSFGRVATDGRKLLSGGLSKVLADASYSVYLIHLLILVPTAYFVSIRLHLNSTERFGIVFLVTAIASYTLALPLHWLEDLGIGVGKHLSKAVVAPLVGTGTGNNESEQRPGTFEVTPVNPVQG